MALQGFCGQMQVFFGGGIVARLRGYAGNIMLSEIPAIDGGSPLKKQRQMVSMLHQFGAQQGCKQQTRAGTEWC